MNKTNRLFIHFILILFSTLSLTSCAKKFGPLYEKAHQYYDQGKYIEAIDNLNLALPFWKDSDGKENKGQAYQLLGQAYHALQNLDKASDAYSKAIAFSTNTYSSACRLGLIYLTSEQYPAAIKSFKDALRMKKDDPEALLGLGNAYYSIRNFEDARIAYQRILDCSPGVKEALENLRVIKDKSKSTSPKKKSPAQLKAERMSFKRSKKGQ